MFQERVGEHVFFTLWIRGKIILKTILRKKKNYYNSQYTIYMKEKRI